MKKLIIGFVCLFTALPIFSQTWTEEGGTTTQTKVSFVSITVGTVTITGQLILTDGTSVQVRFSSLEVSTGVIKASLLITQVATGTINTSLLATQVATGTINTNFVNYKLEVQIDTTSNHTTFLNYKAAVQTSTTSIQAELTAVRVSTSAGTTEHSLLTSTGTKSHTTLESEALAVQVSSGGFGGTSAPSNFNMGVYTAQFSVITSTPGGNYIFISTKTKILNGCDIIPNTNYGSNLGGSANQFNGGWIYTLTINSLAGPSGGTINVTHPFIPYTASATGGNYTKSWIIYISSIYGSGYGIFLSSSIIPTNSGINLGTFNNPFSQIFASTFTMVGSSVAPVGLSAGSIWYSSSTPDILLSTETTKNVDSYKSLTGVTKIIQGTNIIVSNGGTGNVTLDVTSGGDAVKAATQTWSGGNTLYGSTTFYGNVNITKVMGSQAIKAWVVFCGTGTVAINDSYNVTSITDNGTGDYTINWTVPFATNRYVVVGTSRRSNGGAGAGLTTTTHTTGSVRINTYEDTGVLEDANVISIMAIGTQ